MHRECATEMLFLLTTVVGGKGSGLWLATVPYSVSGKLAGRSPLNSALGRLVSEISIGLKVPACT
jgi:hypothetical protein